jgi:hypothetical protein
LAIARGLSNRGLNITRSRDVRTRPSCHPDAVTLAAERDNGSGAPNQPPNDDNLVGWLDDSLRRWASGLPWVVEQPPFLVIDCEPLGRRRVWAVIDSLPKDPQIAGTAHVVLPNWLADELSSSGEGTIALSLGEQHSLVSLHPRTNARGVERLHSLLLMAYASAFCECSGGAT